MTATAVTALLLLLAVFNLALFPSLISSQTGWFHSTDPGGGAGFTQDQGWHPDQRRIHAGLRRSRGVLGVCGGNEWA